MAAVEAITLGMNNLTLEMPRGTEFKSHTPRSPSFSMLISPRYMQQYNEVELFALGMTIAIVVTVTEILKNNRLALEKKIMTSTIDMNDVSRGRPLQKAKIEILLRKIENFDNLMAAAAKEKAEEGEEQI